MAGHFKQDLKLTSCLIKLLRNFNTVSAVNPLRQELTTTSGSREKWDLMSAVCLERKPLITRDFNEIEKKVQLLMNELELENSMKSDHELRCIAGKYFIVCLHQHAEIKTINSSLLKQRHVLLMYNTWIKTGCGKNKRHNPSSYTSILYIL